MDRIGLSYLRGEAQQPKDAVQGRAWVQRAAAAGQPQARFRLALMLLQGVGGSTNEGEAMAWLQRAAEGGLPAAMGELGGRYLGGKGLPQDLAQAARWLTAGAERDHPRAQAMLGLMAADGVGVPKDPVQSAVWLSLASRHDADLAPARDRQLGQLGATQRAEVQRRLQAWQPVPVSKPIGQR